MTRDYEMTCAKYEAEIADLRAKLAEAQNALLLASAENDKLRAQLASDDRQRLYESNCRGENNSLKAKLSWVEDKLLEEQEHSHKLMQQVAPLELRLAASEADREKLRAVVELCEKHLHSDRVWDTATMAAVEAALSDQKGQEMV